MNLVIALLSTRDVHQRRNGSGRPSRVCRQRERRGVLPDVRAGQERIRDLGIPLETGRVSQFDPPRATASTAMRTRCPPVDLTADEAAAVAVATQLWESPELITATQGALLKLRAAGVDVDAGDAGIAITSTAAYARGSAVRGSARNPVVRHRLRRQVMHVSAPARAQRAVHDADGRTMGCGDRRGQLVPRRPRPRPRRHPGRSGCPASAPR